MHLAITALDQPDNINAALLIAGLFTASVIGVAGIAAAFALGRRIADRAQRGRHLCAADGCPRIVPRRKLMCGPDWRLVPPKVQRAVRRAWRHGKGYGTVELLIVQSAATRIADDRRRAAACPWCSRPAGRNLGLTPRDCVCDRPCRVLWCERQPLDLGDDIHRDGTPVALTDQDIDQAVDDWKRGQR